MAADLHIHILTDDFTKEHYRSFIGSSPKYDWNDCYDLCSKTPNVWVGEVSWLKAALFDSEDEFVPGPVAKISEIIGEDFPTIDAELITKIMDAIKVKNSTFYKIADPDSLLNFLEENKGKFAFTISW